jgi:hypothetical protein
VLEFIELVPFTRRLQALAKEDSDDVLMEIQSDLLANPKRGKVVEGTAGVRKARVANPARGKGKSGGFRYLYFYIEQDGQIYLLMIFSKEEQTDLTGEQRKSLAKAVRELKETR